VTGVPKSLAADWSVVVDGPGPVRIAGGDLVALRRVGVALPPRPAGSQLLFANDDCLPGTILRLADERLHIRAALGDEPELAVPLTALAMIRLHDPGPDESERQRRLLNERRTRDVVLFRNGDRVVGTLTAIDTRLIHLESDGQVLPIERAQVSAIALGNELVRSLRPKGAYGRAVLASGCRLGLASARLAGDQLLARSLWGAELAIPLEHLIALDIHQGRAVYLSDLKPKRYEHTPFLGLSWNYAADASVAGRPLQVAGSSFDKGIGLHSQASLTYELAGGFRVFEAVVGLDDRTGRQGHVRIRVLVDGRPAIEDRELTHADGALAVRVNVTGAKELTLSVEFGRGGDVQDHVNWADARLLK
jgi:hypothetical protein